MLLAQKLTNEMISAIYTENRASIQVRNSINIPLMPFEKLPDLPLPSTLDGSLGNNRSLQKPLINASNDIEAIVGAEWDRYKTPDCENSGSKNYLDEYFEHDPTVQELIEMLNALNMQPLVTE
jgi:hypothetical protein